MKKYSIFYFLLLIATMYSSLSLGQNKKWSLEECVDYAIKNNITIKQAELDQKSNEIDKSGAIGAFLPTLSASASHSWNIGLTPGINGLKQVQTAQNSSVGIGSGLTIYNGLQNQERLRRANLSIIASQYKTSKIKDDISLNVASAFLQVLFNKEAIKVQKEQLLINEKQIERTQELVKAGSVPKGDLLDIRATIAATKQAIVTAENALLISKLSLAQLLQLKDFKDFDVVDQDYKVVQSEILLKSPSDVYQKAKEQRYELKIAKSNLEIAQKDIKIARAGYQPSLSANYSFGSSVSYADVASGVDPITFEPIYRSADPILDQLSNNKGHNVSLQLSIPILNGFSVRNSVQRSKISYELSKMAYNQQELDLERNVYTAFTDAKGALNAYESATIALEARTEAYNYAKEKFKVGLLNSFDLNQSQTLYNNAQSEVLRTKYDYIFRTKIIEFYFGIPIIQKK
jgi:outer membrane protein